jgi:CubicO group peptidase (beta-lactamase class C family)
VISDAAMAAIDAAVETEMERARLPGLTLGLTDRDGTLLIRTYGFADLRARLPVTPDTLFEIGSIGKTFTAVATLQLFDEGRIDLHSPVVRYLPWFAVPQPAGHAPITVAHLLSHRAGIVAGIDGTPEAAFQVWSLRDLPTFSAPGERFHYSNVGYKARARAGSDRGPTVPRDHSCSRSGSSRDVRHRARDHARHSCSARRGL